jgi:hypothetical protein
MQPSGAYSDSNAAYEIRIRTLKEILFQVRKFFSEAERHKVLSASVIAFTPRNLIGFIRMNCIQIN